MKRKLVIFFMVISVIFLMPPNSFMVVAADDEVLFNDYLNCFDAVSSDIDIEKNGFKINEGNVYDLEHAALGKLTLIPAISINHNRLALFFVQEDGLIVFKTDNFASNSWLSGSVRQTNHDVDGIAYRDLDGDGLKDIVIISVCKNDSGSYSNRTYNVGDVLFQNETGFYRDYRISDKINRFDMNKNLEAITQFVRDGVSMEFLFTSKTLDELFNNGFYPISYLQVSERMEKFGVVDIVPGFYNTVGQNYLMIYLADADGRILWNFQPMRNYVNFYSISGLSLEDIDGDGNKDLTLLGRFVAFDENGKSFIRQDYNIYYQRAGYFLDDVDVRQSYTCGDDDDINTVTGMARSYWRN